MKNLVPIGLIVIFIGIIIVFIGVLTQLKSSDSKTKVAFGGFIGPFPFGFANDKKMLIFVIALTVFIFVLFYLLRLIKV